MADEKHDKHEKPEKAEKPKTVTMVATQLHTYNGKEYDVGDTYEIDEVFADSVVLQGKAMRPEAKAAKDQQEKAAAKAAADTAKRKT